MKVRKFNEQKLKVREWKLFEVLPLDADDYDYDLSADFHEYGKRRKKKVVDAEYDDEYFAGIFEKTLTFNVVLFTCIKIGWSHFFTFREYSQKEIIKSYRKVVRNKREYIEEDSKSSAVSTACPASPELDTVRVYFDCSSFIDLDLFIPCTASKIVRSVVCNLAGEISGDFEFYRNEMRCSWWGKMTVSKERRKFGKNGTHSIPVLSFEYSVAKWWHYASAVNSGDEPSAELLLLPCIQAMKSMEIQKYSSMDFDYIAKEFLEKAELRRFDLSLNFDVPLCYSPSDYVNVLGRCMLNRQEARRHAEGSISFGTEKSPYRTIFYNKELEAERYYTMKDNTPKTIYFEDPETGKTYRTQNENRTLVEKVFDVNREKAIFYEKNKDKFKNKLRFEVQFRTKFMQEHNLETRGMKNIDNVIRLGKFYWHEILDQFDEQLSRTNFEYKESDKEPCANALATIQQRRDDGIYSRTKANNMMMFIKDCYEKGWSVVKDDIGRDLFSRYSKWVKNETNYDVKVALPQRLPIMRIMDTIMISREGKMISQFKFNPSAIQTCVV